MGSPWTPILIATIAVTLLGFKRRLFFDKKLMFLFLMVFASVPLWLFQGLFIAQQGHHLEFLVLYLVFGGIGVAMAYYTEVINRESELYFSTFFVWLLLNTVFLPFVKPEALIYQAVTGFGGVLVDRNNLAIQTVILMLLSTLTTKNVRINNILVIIGSLLVVFTGSATGILMLFSFLTYKFYQFSQKMKVVFLSLSTLLASYSVYYFADEYANVIKKFSSILAVLTGTGSVEDGSIQSRLWLLYQGLSVWSENLLFGVGLNNSRLYIQSAGRWGESGMNTHNNYLEMLVASGLVGFILHFGIIFFVLLFSGRSSYKNKIRIACIVYLICCLGSVASNHFLSVYIYIFAFSLYLTGKRNTQDGSCFGSVRGQKIMN